MSQLITALVALIALALIASAESNVEQCSLLANRLSSAFRPEHYDLTIKPDLKAMSFKGIVKIKTLYTGQHNKANCDRFDSALARLFGKVLCCGFTSDMSKRRILLNVGKSIQVSEVKVEANLRDDESMEPIGIEHICRDVRNELIAVDVVRRFHVGTWLNIEIPFYGTIGNESRGFYQGELDAQGQDKYVSANTHFLPADARSAFPCFDQPDLKASFELTLIHDKDLESFSNTPAVSVTTLLKEGQDNQKMVKFGKTPKMSTYVFGFAVGNYEPISCQAQAMSGPISVTAYAPLGRSQEAQFTLDTVCRAIPVAEKYFRKNFPLPKLDLVVTKQMRDPARENWGMLVFTEEFLLTDQDTTNVLRVEIAKLTCHVVLHHWMGNLVTTRWWDDQWMFDGFTIWRSHWLAAELYPEFSYEFNYLLRLQSPTLDAHAGNSTHAIKTYQDLDANSEMKLFDANTYNKAGALYQMMTTMISESLLRDSLVKLVERHQYGSAGVQEFFAAIEQVSGINIEQTVRSWLDQPGHPLVSIKRVGGEFEVQQMRLEQDPSYEGQMQTWNIPLRLRFGGGSFNEVITTKFTGKSMRIKPPIWFDIYKPEHWVKVNADFTGFYRVEYESILLKRLGMPGARQNLTPMDKFGIIDDLRALLKLGRVELDVAKDALGWFANEKDGGILSGLAMVIPVLAGAQMVQADIKPIVFKLFGHVYDESGFKVIEGQNHADMNGRQDALMALIQYQHEQAIDEALRVFDTSDIHLAPFLRKPVYLAVIIYGSDDQFSQFIGRLNATKSAYERQILVMSLAPYAINPERKREMASVVGA